MAVQSTHSLIRGYLMANWAGAAFLVFISVTSMIWGAALYRWWLGFVIGQGKLPSVLRERKDTLLNLLVEQEEGGVYPKAPGSEPGLEVKSQ